MGGRQSQNRAGPQNERGGAGNPIFDVAPSRRDDWFTPEL
jgi:hypothetical protein